MSDFIRKLDIAPFSSPFVVSWLGEICQLLPCGYLSPTDVLVISVDFADFHCFCFKTTFLGPCGLLHSHCAISAFLKDCDYIYASSLASCYFVIIPQFASAAFKYVPHTLTRFCQISYTKFWKPKMNLHCSLLCFWRQVSKWLNFAGSQQFWNRHGTNGWILNVKRFFVPTWSTVFGTWHEQMECCHRCCAAQHSSGLSWCGALEWSFVVLSEKLVHIYLYWTLYLLYLQGIQLLSAQFWLKLHFVSDMQHMSKLASSFVKSQDFIHIFAWGFWIPGKHAFEPLL